MIDLTDCHERCYADQMGKCYILNEIAYRCNASCPFYKPRGCKDWVRIGNNLHTPEEYNERFKKVREVKHPTWRIKFERR